MPLLAGERLLLAHGWAWARTIVATSSPPGVAMKEGDEMRAHDPVEHTCRRRSRHVAAGHAVRNSRRGASHERAVPIGATFHPSRAGNDLLRDARPHSPLESI